MREKIIIFDTTLRDGEQSPGAALNIQEKLEIARQLEKLNVDIIEAGFPISSPEQYEAVKAIAGETNKKIAALARVREDDIKLAYDALRNADKKRIHTFASTSNFHILGKFKSSKYGVSLKEKRETVLKMSRDMVAYAKALCEDVEFSAEDAGRTEINYLIEIIEAVIEAGATTVNIPDTTGYTMPEEFGNIISILKNKVKGINKVTISVHCHNDLGLAVANSLAAIRNGARQVECTINGIGERAGNASLEEIVMALYVRQDVNNFYTDIITKEIYNTSRMVSSYTGLVVQPNKAIVGENAFAHESGIHQDGMLKDRNTYEIMTPEVVGVPKTKIVLGRHSGRHGLLARLTELGYKLNEEKLNKIYKEFLILADKKKEVYDEDLRILMGDNKLADDSYIELNCFQVSSGTVGMPTATAKLKLKDEEFYDSAVGDGPIDALFNAIDRAIGKKMHIESYQVRSVTAGRKAMGEVTVRVKNGEKTYIGRGVSTDILEASAKAYIQAINYSLFTKDNKK